MYRFSIPWGPRVRDNASMYAVQNSHRDRTGAADRSDEPGPIPASRDISTWPESDNMAIWREIGPKYGQQSPLVVL
jgi:hypothetical protein